MVVDTEIAREQEELLVQMEESRESLAHKIELLEGKVTETVENATATVQEATANVLETVQNATASVSETVGNVTDAVQGTVETVRTSLYDGVESVKDAFDVSHQVDKHPWLMLLGAAVVGYVGATLLQPSPSRRLRSNGYGEDHYRSLSSPPYEQTSLRAVNTATSMGQYAANDSSLGVVKGAAKAVKEPAQASWMTMLGESFGPELQKLKGLAIGTAIGAVRESILQSAPEAMKKPLAEVIDDVTEKLGGERLQGSLFTADPEAATLDYPRSVPTVPR